MLFGVFVFLSAHFGQEGDIQAGCGAQCPEPTSLSFDVTDFGATPNDATDEDMSAFQAAIDRASKANLGKNTCATVSVPSGVYHFQTLPGMPRGLVLKSNVCLVGEDRDQTVLMGLEPMHTISINRIDSVSVENLTIDNVGSAPGAIGTHGIRLSDASNVLLQGLNIRNSYYYGIGFQGSGHFQRITVNDIDINGTGADAIDFKNRQSLNAEVLLSNIDIANFGMARNGQAGIDVRGKVTMRNINISGVEAGQSGVRFRFTGNGTNGAGGIGSSLTNSKISDVMAGGIGIDITNLENTIRSTIVTGEERQGTGIRVLALDEPEANTNTSISFVAMLNLDTGIESSANGVTVDTAAFLSNNVHLEDRLGATIVTNSTFSRTDAPQQSSLQPETEVRVPSER